VLGQFGRRDARAKETGHRHWSDIFTDEEFAFTPTQTFDGTRRAIAKALVHPFDPHSGGLDEVRIG
jgi:hypothetical protein